jgi:hypothetical protein
MYKYLTFIIAGIAFTSFGFLHSDIILAEQPPRLLSSSFYGGGIATSRDDDKFREDWLLREDSFVGGIEHLKLRYPIKEDWLFKSEITTLPGQRNHDLKFEISKKDLFYARLHYKRFPHYFDDNGGFFKNFAIPFYTIPGNLSSDRDNLLLEFGLTLPDLPVFTFSYQKKSRDGEISSLTWGAAEEGGIEKHIVPTLKDVDDDIHIIKVGAKYKHDIANIEVEQRWESTDLETKRIENNFTDGLPSTADATVIDKKDTDYDSSQTTVKIDKRISKKLSMSGGYRYTKVDNDSETTLRTFNSSGVINPGGFRKNWFFPDSDSDVNSHLWNFNVISQPVKDLTVQGFFRLKSIHRSSDSTFFNDTSFPFDYSPDQAHDITARTNDTIFGEAIRVTYKGISRVTPYLEAELQQGDSEIKENEKLTGFFKRDTDRDYDKQIYTVGTGFYPCKKLSGSFQYRKEYRKNKYHDDIDTEDPMTIDPGGYSAFIERQDFDTDIFITRLTARPISSVSTTFRHEYRHQDIDSRMEGLNRELAHVEIQTFSGSITITPLSNLFITSMVSHQIHRVKTRARYDQRSTTRSFEGDSTSFVNSVVFALNDKTEFTADYQVSLTDNYDDNFTNFASDPIGLALEHDYTMQALTLGAKHKLKKNITLWCKYSLYDFDESHIDDMDDYTAHLFAAGGEIRLW